MILRSTRVLTEAGLEPADVHIKDGTIVEVRSASGESAHSVLDVSPAVIMPGLVDTHVHVNEPGRIEWEGFETATRAAAAGGITTLFDMPLNSIPATTSVAGLDAKREAAAKHPRINVGFIGGVIPGNEHELRPLYSEGIRLFKCFLVPSGVDEFPGVTEADLHRAMPVLAELGATLMVHAELPEHIVPAPSGDPRRYATYLASRPPQAETSAVSLMIRLAEQYGTHVHIVHVSSPESLPLITAARARGVHITCETCPHYLAFAAEDITDGATPFKCAPPIRSKVDREALWNAVLSGDINMIVSDHSPCPPAMKSLDVGNFFEAWGGIASLQLGLPVVWTFGKSRGLTIEQLADRMSAAPARLASLTRKGKIAAGYDADIVVWDPEASFTVDAHLLKHRHPITPYDGMTLEGVVTHTFVGGREILSS